MILVHIISCIFLEQIFPQFIAYSHKRVWLYKSIEGDKRHRTKTSCYCAFNLYYMFIYHQSTFIVFPFCSQFVLFFGLKLQNENMWNFLEATTHCNVLNLWQEHKRERRSTHHALQKEWSLTLKKLLGHLDLTFKRKLQGISISWCPRCLLSACGYYYSQMNV